MKILFYLFFCSMLCCCGGRVDPIYQVEIKWKNGSNLDLEFTFFYAGQVKIKNQIKKGLDVTVISELSEDTFPLPLTEKDSVKIIFSDGKKLIYKLKNYYKEFKDERSPLNHNLYSKDRKSVV